MENQEEIIQAADNEAPTYQAPRRYHRKKIHRVSMKKKLSVAGVIDMYDMPEFTDLRTLANLPTNRDQSLFENACLQAIHAGASYLFVMCPKEHINYFKEKYKTYVYLQKKGTKSAKVGFPIYWFCRIENLFADRKGSQKAKTLLSAYKQVNAYFKSISRLYIPDFFIYMPLNCLYDVRFVIQRFYAYKKFVNGLKISALNPKDPENYMFVIKTETIKKVIDYFFGSKRVHVSFVNFFQNNFECVYKFYLGWSYVINSFADYREYVMSDFCNHYTCKLTYVEDYKHMWIYKDKKSSLFSFRSIWRRDNFFKSVHNGLKPEIYQNDFEKKVFSYEQETEQKFEELDKIAQEEIEEIKNSLKEK